MEKALVAEIYRLHGTASMTLPADSPLDDVINAFVRHPSSRGIFLVDSSQRFVCMVTRTDLLRWAHLQVTRGKGMRQTPIADFFRLIDAKKGKDLACRGQQAVSVKASDTLETALNKMLDYEEDLLPVVDNDGRVIGDLRLSEVLWWVIERGKRKTSE